MVVQDEFAAELTKFYQGYIHPLQASKLLNPGEFEAIFSNFVTLKDSSTKLIAALKAAENRDELDMAGKILAEQVRF